MTTVTHVMKYVHILGDHKHYIHPGEFKPYRSTGASYPYPGCTEISVLLTSRLIRNIILNEQKMELYRGHRDKIIFGCGTCPAKIVFDIFLRTCAGNGAKYAQKYYPRTRSASRTYFPDLCNPVLPPSRV